MSPIRDEVSTRRQIRPSSAVRKRTLALRVLFVMLVLVGLTIWSRGGRFVQQSDTEPMSELRARRIMVVAPHCDDETLGTGGLIADSVKSGKQVKVVIVTNGDGYKWAEKLFSRSLITSAADLIKFGYDRQNESLQALKILGVPREDVVFLGYPDRGLQKLWFENWGIDRLYKNPYTKTDRSPYVNSYTLKTPYCGAALTKDLMHIIRDFAPDQIFIPHPNDAHPDHWATFAFAEVALKMLREEDRAFRQPQVKTYLVHRGKFPLPQKIGYSLPLVPPKDLEINDSEWQQYKLSPEAVQQKRKAVLAFHSQTDVTKKFLLRFVRSNELFCVAEPTHVASLDLDKEPVIDRKDFLEGAAPAVADPVADDLTRRVERGADFTGLYAFETPQNLDITLSVATKISPNVKYLVDIWLFPQAPANEGTLLASPRGHALGTGGNNRAYRVVIEVRKRKIASAALQEMTLEGASPVDISKSVLSFFDGGNLSIIISREVLPEDTGAFVGAFTYLRNRVFVDRTAYRNITLLPPSRVKPF